MSSLDKLNGEHAGQVSERKRLREFIEKIPCALFLPTNGRIRECRECERCRALHETFRTDYILDGPMESCGA